MIGSAVSIRAWSRRTVASGRMFLAGGAGISSGGVEAVVSGQCAHAGRADGSDGDAGSGVGWSMGRFEVAAGEMTPGDPHSRQDRATEVTTMRIGMLTG